MFMLFVSMVVIVMVMMVVSSGPNFMAVRSDEPFNAKEPDNSQRHPPTKQALRPLHGFRHDVEEGGAKHHSCCHAQVKLEGRVSDVTPKGKIAAKQRGKQDE
jgi:hypothetical protein